MKTLKNIILFILFIIVTSSCQTTEKFTIAAPPETKIFIPNQTSSPAAVVHSSQTSVKMDLPSDMYCGYLLAKTADYPFDIPMGIDYKNKNHTGTKTALYAGIGLTSVGLVLSGAGLGITLAEDDSDDDNTGAFFALYGLVGVSIGAGMGMPAQSRLRQTSYDYNFGYEKRQVFTKQPLSTKLIHPNPSKENLSHSQTVKSDRKKATSGTANQQNGTTKVNASKAKKLKTDISSKIVGRYSGTGKLIAENQIVDSYSNIVVQITRVDRNHVNLIILESGDDFFESPLLFTVEKNRKGGFTLSMDNLDDVSVIITKDGKITLNHPQVLIDEDLFKLTISARK